MTNPVQQQLEAYNDRDIDRFMDAYVPEARYEDGDGGAILTGAQEMREFFGAMFANSPELHCDVVSRISVGDWVIDEERVTGVQAEGFPEEIHAAVAYKVEDGKITFARILM